MSVSVFRVAFLGRFLLHNRSDNFDEGTKVFCWDEFNMMSHNIDAYVIAH